MRYFDGSTFERNGREFSVEFPHDNSLREPWKEHDDHGVVSEPRHHPFGYGTKPPKSPSERILYWERGHYRTYDMRATMAIARRDGWGLSPDDVEKLAKKLGRPPTKGDIRAEAVERDFQYLRAWCEDRWSWCGVVVKHVDDEGNEETESLWGIESDATDYLADVAHELADEINARLDDEMACSIQESRPDMQPA